MDGITKVALVTGASSGIGEAISRELVGLGYIVFGIARSLDNLLKVQNELKEAFARILGVGETLGGDIVLASEKISYLDRYESQEKDVHRPEED